MRASRCSNRFDRICHPGGFRVVERCASESGHAGDCVTDEGVWFPALKYADADGQTLAVRADVGAIRERQAGCAHGGVAAGRMCLRCGAVVDRQRLPPPAHDAGAGRLFDAIDAALSGQPLPEPGEALWLDREGSERDCGGDVILLLRRGARTFVATVAGAVADEAPEAGLRQVAAGIVAGILR